MTCQRASQVALVVKNKTKQKNSLANAGDMRHRFNPWVRKIPLEEVVATHPSILTWKIQWTEEYGGL